MLKILHISDLHFGPYHWDGNDEELIRKINSYDADLVINTGDSTSDGIEREYLQAKEFLGKIKCRNLISIIGNHDKRTRSSVEFFKKYLSNPAVIYPDETEEIKKKYLYLNDKMQIDEKFTDLNFVKRISIRNMQMLIIALDSNVLYHDTGMVEENILNCISKELNNDSCDSRTLLIHHSVLGTDECPLHNSQRVIDFINFNKIKYVFCGHTHENDFRISEDIHNKHRFFQFMCGATSSNDLGISGKNFFILYEIGDESIHRINLIKVNNNGSQLSFEDESILYVKASMTKPPNNKIRFLSESS